MADRLVDLQLHLLRVEDERHHPDLERRRELKRDRRRRENDRIDKALDDQSQSLFVVMDQAADNNQDMNVLPNGRVIVNGRIYKPLDNLAENQAKFVILNTILSEYAILGFEWGFASADPRNLVIW